MTSTAPETGAAQVVGAGRPPAYLRICVVVGTVTLLVGIVGMFLLDRPNPAFLRLHGVVDEMAVDPHVAFEVEASWEDEQGELHGKAGTSGRDPDIWLFYDLPKGKEVTLVVYRITEAERREVLRATRPLDPGKVTELGIKRGP